jgi:hypothetical protein
MIRRTKVKGSTKCRQRREERRKAEASKGIVNKNRRKDPYFVCIGFCLL